MVYQIIPFEAPLGAEIHGLDLRAPLDALTLASLRADLHQYLLLMIRRQDVSPAAQVEFASAFGRPDVHGIVPGMPGQAVITEIRKEPEHLHNFGGTWHFDLSFQSFPPVAAVLVARELPDTGGDTLWANQYLAYESLPAPLRCRIDTLTALHSDRVAFGSYGGRDGRQEAEHLLAPVHPETGRRYLFANPVSIERVAGRASGAEKALLDELYASATRTDFQYRHRWQVGDVVVWDNRATMHMAMNDYAGQRRVMHRVSVYEDDIAQSPRRIAKSGRT